MREYPKFLGCPMVRLILAGKKTMDSKILTRQNSVLSPKGDWSKLCWDSSENFIPPRFGDQYNSHRMEKAIIPYVDYLFPHLEYLHVPYNYTQAGTIYRIRPRHLIGDRFWIKESWKEDVGGIYFKADSPDWDMPWKSSLFTPWKSSLFMPRKASRLTLEIMAIKCRQLKDMPLDDVVKEGFATKEEFLKYFAALNKRKKGMAPNPWIWSYEFKRVVSRGQTLEYCPLFGDKNPG